MQSEIVGEKKKARKRKTSAMSLMKLVKRSGPRFDPWGSPEKNKKLNGLEDFVCDKLHSFFEVTSKINFETFCKRM